MSAVGELAANLVEFGGDLHTRGGWLARSSTGQIVDGYRYARHVPCDGRGCGAATCDTCAWQYVGRAFADDDAVTVLLEVLEAEQLEESAREIMPAPRAGDVEIGRAEWHGATGEWTISYGEGSGTIGGPSHMSGLADALRRHGYTSDAWHVAADGRLTGIVLERDWSEAP